MLIRKFLRSLAVGVATVLVVGLVAMPSASANPICDVDASELDGDQWAEFAAECLDSTAFGGGGPRVCTLNALTLGNREATTISCIHPDFGWWNNSVQCYILPADEQPGPDDSRWDHPDRDPEDGQFYEARCPFLEGVDGLGWTTPELEAAVYIAFSDDDLVGALIDQALARISLSGPDIHMAPDPDGAGLVGLPVWMWTPVTDSTWTPEPVQEPLELFDFTLVVTPVVEEIEWDMGNGDVPVICDTPGTPYDPSYGISESPDCGYSGYAAPSRTQPDGVYTVTGTTAWVISWELEGTSLSSTLPTQFLASETTVTINELQVLYGGAQ